MSKNPVPPRPGSKESKQARWKRLNPWARYVEWARRRVNCRDERGWWPHYGAKGIRCFLTAEQLKEIWERDRAHELKKPSLDRRDPSADYANWNVRFIEFNLNSRMAWDPTAREGYQENAPEFY